MRGATYESKEEIGKAIPNSYMMLELCYTLGINVNELFYVLFLRNKMYDYLGSLFLI